MPKMDRWAETNCYLATKPGLSGAVLEEQIKKLEENQK